MAELFSEEENCPSSLAIISKAILPNQFGDELWQQVRLCLKSGGYSIYSSSEPGFSLCRRPRDEITTLIARLKELSQGKRRLVLFEPSEPSFELNFEKAQNNIKVEAWIDAGNARTGIYTWDAMGIRFFTTCQHLNNFLQQLELEFILST